MGTVTNPTLPNMTKTIRQTFSNWRKSSNGQSAIQILKRSQRFLCPSCLQHLPQDYHVHHLFPISKMDSSNSNLAIDINNLVLLCPKCNLSQGAKIDTRFSDLEPEDRVSIDG